jgi:leucyl-tRNA synthetase
METYDPQAIEAKWQKVWEDERAFYTADPEPGEQREKFYMLEMLPYPSGDQHMGHVLNYTLGDVLTHFRRRHGLRVLRPMGWDSFGLPAENAAIREGGHPREITERNIANIERQMHRLGWAIDWDRVIAAHDPAYYRWTQWLFLRFFERASPTGGAGHWCPNDQTVLANEQVIDGRCERCGAVVEARKMEQWFFRITAYADALLEDHATIDWPARTITIQRNWIGRSEGAELLFRIGELDMDVAVFTTRPDTIFGATYFVLAPEHPLVADRAVAAVTDQGTCATRWQAAKSGRRPRRRRGVHGAHGVNPRPAVPVWVADYVLMGRTGAIMAVPGHDERDRGSRSSSACRCAGRRRGGWRARRFGRVLRTTGRG